MREAHARALDEGMNDKHIDMFARHLLYGFAAQGISPDDIKEIHGIIYSFKDAVMARKIKD